MKLRKQLMFAAALSLLVPLAAYRAIHQMDDALRQSRADDLLQRANATRAVLEFSGSVDTLNQIDHPNFSRSFYVEAIDHNIYLDGYADDWVNQKLTPIEFSFKDNKSPSVVQNPVTSAQLRVRLAASRNHLYLFLDIPKDKMIFHNPSSGILASGDYLELYVKQPDGDLERSTLRAVAPGSFTAFRYGKRFEGLQPILPVMSHRGSWVSEQQGFQVELQLPIPPAGTRFGVTFVDRDRKADSSRKNWIGTHDPHDDVLAKKLWPLVLPSFEVSDLLRKVVPAGSRVRVFDDQGKLRGEANRLYEKPDDTTLIDPAKSNFFNAILFRFFEWMIRQQQAGGGQPFVFKDRFQLVLKRFDLSPSKEVHSYITTDRDRVMGALTSFDTQRKNIIKNSVAPQVTVNPAASTSTPYASVMADQVWILFETSEDNTNAFTSSAMVRIFSLITLVSLLVAGALLVFASTLSWRIKRLSIDAKTAVTGEGKFNKSVTPSNARDEIGELSRDFASLVDRSAGYTQYLESLASKLSHELRTPLSVVQTSLENLVQESLDDVNATNSEANAEARQRQRLLLQRALGGSAQMSRLIKSMSEAARFEQTIQDTEFCTLDLCTWLGNLGQLYRQLYPAYRFEVQIPTSTVSARVAPELLQQAFDKLTANAVDFSPRGGVIVFTLENPVFESNRVLSLSVGNQGCGFQIDQIERVFEPMVSLRTAPGSTVPHLGLGLYVVKLIAEAHGGQVFALDSDDGVVVGFTFDSP